MRSIPTLAFFLGALVTGALAYAAGLHPERLGLSKAGFTSQALIYIVASLIVLCAALWVLVVWRLRCEPYSLVKLSVGLVVVAGGLFGLHIHQILTTNGVTTYGEITGRHKHLNTYFWRVVPLGTESEYFVDYTYSVAGKVYTDRDISVSEDVWNEMASNASVPIRYLPEGPMFSEIGLPEEQGHEWFMPSMCFLFGGLFLISALCPPKGKRPRFPTPLHQRRGGRFARR